MEDRPSHKEATGEDFLQENLPEQHQAMIVQKSARSSKYRR